MTALTTTLGKERERGRERERMQMLCASVLGALNSRTSVGRRCRRARAQAIGRRSGSGSGRCAVSRERRGRCWRVEGRGRPAVGCDAICSVSVSTRAPVTRTRQPHQMRRHVHTGRQDDDPGPIDARPIDASAGEDCRIAIARQRLDERTSAGRSGAEQEDENGQKSSTGEQRQQKPAATGATVGHPGRRP